MHRLEFAIKYLPACVICQACAKDNWSPRSFLMEPLWWSHLVAPLCISSLPSVNYTWFTRCLRDSKCEASICEWVIALERERGDGRIYHSLTWQDVLQLSLVELEWVISAIALIGDDLSQVYAESRHECVWACVTCKRRCITASEAQGPFLSFFFWGIVPFVQVGLIAHRTGVSEVCVCTDGSYSTGALCECC